MVRGSSGIRGYNLVDPTFVVVLIRCRVVVRVLDRGQVIAALAGGRDIARLCDRDSMCPVNEQYSTPCRFETKLLYLILQG